MSRIRRVPILVVLLLCGAILDDRALALCSPSDLDGVRAELRATEPPACGPRTLRRAFKRSRNRAAAATARAVIQCALAETPHVARAHDALARMLAKVTKLQSAGTLAPDCASAYETALATLDAALTAAENGTTTTTTTSVPGAPTTTTQGTCTTVSLEVCRGDCTGVTSIPRGIVKCGANCDDQIFVVPGFGSLQLLGTPAPGDVGVTWDGDCNDDGTVPLGDASPPDCSLSCDCSSGQ